MVRCVYFWCVRCVLLWCGVLWCGVVWCGVFLCGAMVCGLISRGSPTHVAGAGVRSHKQGHGGITSAYQQHYKSMGEIHKWIHRKGEKVTRKCHIHLHDLKLTNGGNQHPWWQEAGVREEAERHYLVRRSQLHWSTQLP